MKKISVFFVLLSALLGGCYYDNFEELYPNAGEETTCDTLAPITYTKHVAPTMSAYCVTCHATGAASGGIVLDNYTDVVNVAASGKLVASIRHEPGHPAMPPNGQLDECSIREIELWIQNNYAQ